MSYSIIYTINEHSTQDNTGLAVVKYLTFEYSHTLQNIRQSVRISTTTTIGMTM